MKTLLLYIYYFFRSVYYRGLGKTLKLLSYEKKYEKLFGIETGQIKKSDHQDNYHYQGAGYMVLLDIFNQLPSDLKKKGFVDYGSGKGRALFCAEYCGFNRLIGVELDKELNEAAKQNLARYRLMQAESRFEFVNANALEFEIPDNCGIFYFFNPFSDTIMAQVAKRIYDYAEKNRSEVLIVYLNPQYRTVWTEAGFKEDKIIKTNRYTEAVIYRKSFI